MDINYRWYEKDFTLDKYAYKEEIINYIYNNDTFDKVLKNDRRVSIHKALSDINSNIVSWYNFEENSDLLEVSCGLGEFTGAFCERLNTVTSISFNKEEAEALKKRCDKYNNLEIICATLLKIELDKKYDYITLFGVLENANIILDDYKIDSKSAAIKILNFVSRLLKEDGKILICTDNRMAVRNLVGYKDYMNKYAFSDIVHKKDILSHRTFTKSEIVDILNQCKFLKYNFYYPLPDYNFSSVIFSDKYMPKEDNSKLMYSLCYDDYMNIFYDERILLKELIKQGEFENFANCFFIEIGNQEIKNKFVSFNNFRKKEFRNITKMQDKIVLKSTIDNSSNHIQNIDNYISKLKQLGFNVLDRVNNNIVESEYVEYKTLDNIICDMLKQGKKEEIENIIEKYFEYIKSKLVLSSDVNNNIFKKYGIEIEKYDISKLNFVENGFLDLTFENVFYNLENYFIYDQEWCEQNVPIEFIIYRAINNLYYYNSNLELYINKKDILRKYCIDEWVEIFDLLEQKWQDTIYDEHLKKFFSEACSAVNTYEDIEDKKLKLVNEYENKIQKLSDEKKDLEDKLANIVNSRTWKYTKIFRKE